MKATSRGLSWDALLADRDRRSDRSGMVSDRRTASSSSSSAYSELLPAAELQAADELDGATRPCSSDELLGDGDGGCRLVDTDADGEDDDATQPSGSWDADSPLPTLQPVQHSNLTFFPDGPFVLSLNTNSIGGYWKKYPALQAEQSRD